MTRAYAPDGDMDAELSAFFHKHMADGSMVEWVAEEAGEIIATGAVVFYDLPPAFFDPVSIRGYVTNMYTAPPTGVKASPQGCWNRCGRRLSPVGRGLCGWGPPNWAGRSMRSSAFGRTTPGW